ncbi:hypothetical protein BOX15_Mlig012462g13 [Macrostomum lignano]|uniref:Uncharacterized protein n=1 Tax=Macrostomum lignano TaxID=282301 RepID=A0A267GI41_9PLAT|nr:hypothetical protein BOX15_Mlig012462g13 [Macrostomum lignano]
MESGEADSQALMESGEADSQALMGSGEAESQALMGRSVRSRNEPSKRRRLTEVQHRAH